MRFGTVLQWRKRRNHNLSEREVMEILTWCRKRVTARDLACRYKVNTPAIYKIKSGITHKKVFKKWCALTALREIEVAERRV